MSMLTDFVQRHFRAECHHFEMNLEVEDDRLV